MITILYNPWCKDDVVYMESEDQLEEYVLNDQGCVYRGQAFYPKGKAWNFGQFEDGILDICFYLVMKCFKENQRHRLSDPVKVSRVIAQVVNCNDRDRGVLHGRWDGDYSDGESPSNWYGSVRILRRYWKTKKPVKYGQCWVFSGLTTTVCRALGIPALSVTNFSSAHDTDDNNVIEKYFKRDKKGNLKFEGGDSIWNYHLWNQVYMKRPDLSEYGGKYDGWQAIDATPQERSEGVFTCGPAPLKAIMEGHVYIPYDTGFLFAEVNGDELYLEQCGNSCQVLKIRTNTVGKSISTKKPDGKKYEGGFWDRQREDVTKCYKYPEGSVENRNAVMRAAVGADRVSEFYTGEYEKADIKFKLLHDAKLVLGKDVEVKLMAENVSEHSRTLKNVRFDFMAMKYTGHMGKVLGSRQQDIDYEIKPQGVFECKVKLEASDYVPHLDDSLSMCIQASAIVERTSSRPLQNCIKSHDVTFQEPELEVKVPAFAKVGEEFEAAFKFENPLNAELTDCLAGYEGRGFKHVTGVKQDNIPPYGTGQGKFTMKGMKRGHFSLTFKFTAKQLKYLSGTAEVDIN